MNTGPKPTPEGALVLTKRQMAAALQIHPRTLTRLMQRGEIAYLRIGRAVRFRPDDALNRMAKTILVPED